LRSVLSSSDTFVIQQGFSCFDLDGNPQSQDVCAFGSAGFNPNASKTFAPFPGVSFNITYTDGEFLLGPVGLDTVTIGELSVEKQVVPIPNRAAYLGDGINSGIIVRLEIPVDSSFPVLITCGVRRAFLSPVGRPSSILRIPSKRPRRIKSFTVRSSSLQLSRRK
jgi:hypothetical protein